MLFKSLSKTKITLISLLFVIVLLVAGILLGSKKVGVSDFWNVLINQDLTMEESYYRSIFELRFVRSVAVLLCGAALGISAALMQGLTRNYLADTGLLGVNAGAAAAIVSTVFIPTVQVDFFWIAFLGATTVAAFVSLIGLKGNDDNYSRLILIGTAISICLFSYVQTVAQLNLAVMDKYRFWMSGAFSNITWADICHILPMWILGMLAAMCLGYSMNVLSLGRQSAQSLGARILLIQIIALLVATNLSAVTVVLAGPISFIGLGAIHIARYFFGVDYKKLLPSSACIGAVLLLSADILTRVVVAPSEIATGIMTALLGAPLLYILVLRGR